MISPQWAMTTPLLGINWNAELGRQYGQLTEKMGPGVRDSLAVRMDKPWSLGSLNLKTVITIRLTWASYCEG